jgi:exopolysaccharide biosynthesis polyprenyl glycosylphosphotransferase
VTELRGIEATQMSAQAPAAVAPPAPLVDEPAAAVGHAGGQRRNAHRRWALTCLRIDGATLAAALLGAMVVSTPSGLGIRFSGWTVAFIALTIALFHNQRLYQLRLKTSVLDDAKRIAGAVTVAAMTVLTARLLLHPSAGPELEVVRAWVFALVYVVGGRTALYWSQSKVRAAGESLRPTLVLGAGRVGRVVARRLAARPQLGLEVVGFVDASPLLEGEGDALEAPVLGSPDRLEELVARFRVEHVVVTFSNERDDVVLGFVNRAEALGATVSVVPRLYEKVPERVTVEHLGGLPLVTPHATDPRGGQIAVKYVLDRVAGALLVVLAAPFLLASALAVYVSMGRPIFFRQVRVGRDGEAFEILKFRSMKLPTPEELDLQRKAMAEGLPGGVEGVDRRTRVGTLLRKTSLDELPQLLNVLRGEMSVVGPRPERPEYVSKFERSVYRYTDRHRVKSGITGWAQVHGLRGKTSIEDRAEWDNWYVENFSLWLDVKILAMTVAAVAGALRDTE